MVSAFEIPTPQDGKDGAVSLLFFYSMSHKAVLNQLDLYIIKDVITQDTKVQR